MTYRARCAGRHPKGRRPKCRSCRPVLFADILKHTYPAGRHQEIPAWAKLAYRRGWMTLREYLDAKPWPDAPWRPGLNDFMYANNPYFRAPHGTGWPGGMSSHWP